MEKLISILNISLVYWFHFFYFNKYEQKSVDKSLKKSIKKNKSLKFYYLLS